MTRTSARIHPLAILITAIALGAAGMVMAGSPQSQAAIHRPSLPARLDPGEAAASNSLFSVAATSDRNAWAVGSLILHWDGRKWSIQRAKTAGCRAEFLGVTARSAAAAWAAGTCTSRGTKAIIDHWDGRQWKVQPSPAVSGFSELLGIKAISRSDAWAVGAYQSHATLNL